MTYPAAAELPLPANEGRRWLRFEAGSDDSGWGAADGVGKMVDSGKRQWRDMTKAERRALLVGDALKHDEEDIEYWRNATDEMRGRALYDLLEFTQRVLDSGEISYGEEPLFPGFPKRRSHHGDPAA